MVAFAATDWTVEVLPTTNSDGDDEPFRIHQSNGQRRTNVRFTMSNENTRDYVVGGLPMPTFNPSAGPDFGMRQRVDRFYIQTQPPAATAAAEQLIWVYSPTAHTMLGYTGNASNAVEKFHTQLTATWSPSDAYPVTPAVFIMSVEGW